MTAFERDRHQPPRRASGRIIYPTAPRQKFATEPKKAAITIAGIELMHRIRKGQFALARLGVQGQAAPSVWNAVLTA
jgi:hypothetical protein